MTFFDIVLTVALTGSGVFQGVADVPPMQDRLECEFVAGYLAAKIEAHEAFPSARGFCIRTKAWSA